MSDPTATVELPADPPAKVDLPPDPFRMLRYDGWPAADEPYRRYAAGEITYEHALALTLDAIRRDWGRFWRRLRQLAPELTREVANAMVAGNFRLLDSPPLIPDRVPVPVTR